MNKAIALLVGVLLCTSAFAKDKEKKDYIVGNGDGTYSCSGSSASCAQVNQQRNAIWEQRDRERQRERDRQREENMRNMREAQQRRY